MGQSYFGTTSRGWTLPLPIQTPPRSGSFPPITVGMGLAMAGKPGSHPGTHHEPPAASSDLVQ